ncbi:MAG: bifunctional sulfate adenylyltransferase/adenylylsulfate kinase [Candidatus Marinimicrobia bacterium]|nr:bifunctional sulfate adenylyltransferase/adenylylsulfate kinase [Candidatus Neomarinimicrobiota bacterium]
MPSSIIAPHGGRLVNLLLPPDEARTLKGASIKFPSVSLNDRQLCDLELLLNGGFSPLTGFLGREDYESVLARLRLADDSLWPMPVTLDVSEQFAQSIDAGARVILRDKEGFPLAVLTVTDIWRPDLEAEARQLFGTTDLLHPGAFYLLDSSQPVYLGGTLQGITPPKHYDYQLLRHTPAEVRDRFTRHGWDKVVAFQTRNPLHRAHLELTHRAAGSLGANLLIHPVVGLTKPGDVDHYTRVRCYEHVIEKYPAGTAMLSLLPLAMRMGGPREALWHAIIRKNYGCGYFIVGRDHAGPGQDSEGQPFYGPYDAQDLLREHEKELGIRMIPFKMMVYVEDRAEFMPVDEVPEGARTLEISGTELRRRLDKGLDIPDWYSFPEVVAELRKARPPLSQRGFTVFFTGLSGSGKSTLANGLLVKLLEDGRRPVTLLDGDIVRTNLSSELGFSQEHRSINVRRIGFVASEITKNGGVAVCAPIAPYQVDRQFNRELISRHGGYIEVYVSTPLEVCERRDVKGLYALARAGKLKQFTGIDDPYEEPRDAEIVVDSSSEDPETLAQSILLGIERLGYL